MAVEQLAHWWNGIWGTMARRDVWAERLEDGRYQVRWRGGEWTDRDGRHWTADKTKAWMAVRSLIGEGEDWRRIDANAPSPSQGQGPAT